MMKSSILKYSFLLLFIALLNSCGIFPNSKKGFAVYKKSLINEESSSNKLRINGVYGKDTNGKGFLFYFYKNGFVKVIGWTNDFYQNQKKYLDYFESNWQFESKEAWGQYSINNDTLTIQTFNRNPHEFFKRQVIEDKCLITSDTTFIMLSSTLYSINHFTDRPVTYQFYPTELKPDSTKAWFNNKRWFKKGLHESRKPKVK